MSRILTKDDRERLAAAKQLVTQIGGMAVRADIARRAALAAKFNF